MDSRTQERVEQWTSRSFSGGDDGLASLADSGFSGAVTAAGSWLFMLNGRIVGVFDGDIEDVTNASGTVYEAPHPSLPLLCTMEERGGEPRAKYYTNETPLRDVDETLQDGSFTGYVELSENVHSGDYYAVYYGGRRMAAAYIGNAERLLTGDEAFERAADEVGIYEVIDVEIDVTDVSDVIGSPGSDPTPETTAERGSATETHRSSTTPGPADPDPSTDPTADPGSDPIVDSGSDPTADSSGGIDPIDVSGTDSTTAEDASSGIDELTIDDPSALQPGNSAAEGSSGITTTDESEIDPEPTSNGITGDSPSIDTDDADAEPSAADHQSVVDETAGATRQSSTDGTTERSSADGTSAEASSSPGDVRSSEPPIEEAEPSTDSGSASDDEPTESAPDLAEVEAAAEELDRSDISWVEDEEEDDDGPATADDTDGSTSDGETGDSAADDELEERFEEEEQWRETRSIPSIDPDNSETSETAVSASGAAAASQRGRRRSSGSATSEADDSGAQSQGSARNAADRNRSSRRSRQADTSRDDESRRESSRSREQDATSKRTDATDRLEELRTQYETLRAKASELETERDRLRSENQELSATVERLQSRIEDLEAALERAREADASGDDGRTATTQLSPQQALTGTNLFVRYASKSQPTLETAHEGGADRGEVASNVRLERHTGFDAADAAVDGQPYAEFLTSSMEYRFVDWLVETTLYEIRDTGHADALGDLYDAIPRIDRAELHASISLEDDETEDVPDEVSFDVVAYDKMGNPLVVANLNDSREPATEGMLEEMEAAASAVKANYPDLAAAVVVTSSYFEPGALEVTEQATSGGFLSRTSKLSYVNLSRKQGYHLCLVESRSEGFHMNVPEL